MSNIFQKNIYLFNASQNEAQHFSGKHMFSIGPHRTQGNVARLRASAHVCVSISLSWMEPITSKT